MADLDATAALSQTPSVPHPAEGPNATHANGCAGSVGAGPEAGCGATVDEEAALEVKSVLEDIISQIECTQSNMVECEGGNRTVSVYRSLANRCTPGSTMRQLFGESLIDIVATEDLGKIQRLVMDA